MYQIKKNPLQFWEDQRPVVETRVCVTSPGDAHRPLAAAIGQGRGQILLATAETSVTELRGAVPNGVEVFWNPLKRRVKSWEGETAVNQVK